MSIKTTSNSCFSHILRSLRTRGHVDNSAVESVVRDILSDVRLRGDIAVKEYTLRFDGVNITRGGRVSKKSLNEAVKSVSSKDMALLERAALRIADFHGRQVQDSLTYKDNEGNMLGTRVTPLGRVSIYVPGGKASYPSTVLMNAIPAKVAGVDEIIMTTPSGREGINAHVLAAAVIAGVDKVYAVGGAQAIGAAAYGTKTIPAVDKITGPGNIYVATAKRQVFGTVDIDMIAGPSEILIINDGTGEAAWIAADMLSQAEHDELASSILITTTKKMAREVKAEITSQLAALRPVKRRKVAEQSIASFGHIIVVKDLAEAAKISNEIAPEHLELFVDKPEKLLGSIRNAGAVFLGTNTPEAVGDYMAGPNHTLPTGGTARFSSPLGVYDFVKRTSIIGFSDKGIKALGRDIKRFADLEGLTAHGKSVKKRL